MVVMHESDRAKVLKRKRGKAKPRKAKPKSDGLCSACGSSTHKRSTHRDCPFNTKRSTAKTSTKPVIVAVDSPSQSSDAVSDVHSISDVVSETGGIDSDDYMMYDLCTCGSSGRAHKRDCFMNFVCHSFLVNQSQILPILLPLVIQDLLV